MGKTVFSGPVLMGHIKTTALANIGTVNLEQDVVFTIPANITTHTDVDGQNFSYYNQSSATAFGGTGVAATAVINIPANAQISAIYIDVPVALVGPTAANITVGIAAAGQDYVSTVDLIGTAATRLIPTFTHPQLLAMMNVTTNLTVSVTLTGTVAPFSAGAVFVQVIYSLTPQ